MFSSRPHHRLAVSNTTETVEQLLERKYRKYFGRAQSVPLSRSMPATGFGSYTNNLSGYIPQIPSFSWLSGLQPGWHASTSADTGGSTLHEALLHHKEWLNNLRRDIGLTSGGAQLIISDGRVPDAVQSLSTESVQVSQQAAV